MKRLRWFLAGAFVAIVAGIGVWYFVLRSDAPKQFTIDTATSNAPGTAPIGPLAGAWVVGKSADGTASAVGYRVSERFAGGAANVDAVGRTTAVNGTMTITGLAVTKASVTADLTRLTSDKAQRDNKLRTQGLETGRFPAETFTLTSPIDLGSQSGVVKTNATGTLALHGRTRPVTVAVEASRNGDRIVVVGNAPVVFADYGIEAPSIPGFVTVASTGTMEFQLFFVRA